ncbi:hypothetical protein E1287_01675 [Actinomadura sp. KC06]|uniref:hypothetical protein n=1 Tax=Actinomadura sp. KC06 TaxID=2530369 RepID=UPI0010503588|nr:hypothetical protein [Actinomadura sp. KC06]TDD40247.1 hypothetical protein E1287_01675 [Actinomadura sp. KC06]
MTGPVGEESARRRPAEGLMVGVDHTSGTDTKTETPDQPQAPDSTSQPPPDRPGSPGQQSRLESRAAARAPAETEAEPQEPQDSDETKDDEPGAEKSDVQQPTENDRDTPRGPRAESWARAQGTDTSEDNREPVADTTPPDERTNHTPASDTTAPEGSEPLPADREPASGSGETGTESVEPGEPNTGQQPTERDDIQPSPEGEERPDENSDGTNEDRGRNPENQPASPAAEETETDPFAGLPTRADLDPASAGALTRERGEPLTPINENQDLSEPDPEDDSDWNRFLRSTRNDNVEEAVKTINDVGIKAQKILGDRPPTGHPGVVHDRNPQFTDTQHIANYGDAATGVIGVAIVVAELGRRAHNGIRRMRGNEHGDHR